MCFSAVYLSVGAFAGLSGTGAKEFSSYLYSCPHPAMTHTRKGMVCHHAAPPSYLNACTALRFLKDDSPHLMLPWCPLSSKSRPRRSRAAHVAAALAAMLRTKMCMNTMRGMLMLRLQQRRLCCSYACKLESDLSQSRDHHTQRRALHTLQQAQQRARVRKPPPCTCKAHLGTPS